MFFPVVSNVSLDPQTTDAQRHTAGLDTIFVQIYMDALPGVSKDAQGSTKHAI